jgi:glycosyltransferase involved in cell wall biosynthesis
MVPSRAQLEDTVRSHLLRRSRVHVVPNGIDVDMFSPGDRSRTREVLGLGEGVAFVWLGRMYSGKGVHVAVRALAQTDGATLVLVGDGESRGELEALATETGVQDRVIFAGMQPRERIPLYLRSADALVFPSLLPEAAPLTPLQAMACGIPVIGSMIGAIPEAISEPGANGLLVRPGDVEDLALNMGRLIGDERLRMQMGAAARERVLAEYTVERMIERTLDVYATARSRFDSQR